MAEKGRAGMNIAFFCPFCESKYLTCKAVHVYIFLKRWTKYEFDVKVLLSYR